MLLKKTILRSINSEKHLRDVEVNNNVEVRLQSREKKKKNSESEALFSLDIVQENHTIFIRRHYSIVQREKKILQKR